MSRRLAFLAAPGLWLALCAAAACATPAATPAGDTGAGADLAGSDAASSDAASSDAGSSDAGSGDPGSSDVASGDASAGDLGPADASGDTATGGAAAQAEAWCAAWAAATCALWVKCPLAALGQPLDGCSARLTQQCQGGAALAKALQAKHLTFDAAQAQTCLAGLQALACPALYQGLVSAGGPAVAACAAVWHGQVAAGGSCVLGGECQAGTRCVFGASCPGTCQAWSAIGGACSDSKPCNPEVASCTAGKCQALPSAPGQACPAGLCASPLYCGPAGACVAFALEGQACSASGAQCWPSLGCWAAAGQAGTCKPRGGVGSACLSQANCALTGDGAPLLCVAGSCQPAPAPGKPCVDWQCQGGWCDSQALPPTCVAWPAAGQACPQGWCGPGAVCSAGTCKALGGPGKPCAAPQDCASGQCVGGACSAAGVSPCL